MSVKGTSWNHIGLGLKLRRTLWTRMGTVQFLIKHMLLHKTIYILRKNIRLCLFEQEI